MTAQQKKQLQTNVNRNAQYNYGGDVNGRFNANSQLDAQTFQQNEAIPLDLLPNKKTLFYDDVRTGLNTRDKWWALGLNSIGSISYEYLGRSINAVPGSSWGWNAVWDPDLEIINFVIDPTGQSEEPDAYIFILQSKNYIKVPPVGSTFGLFGGVYEPGVSPDPSIVSMTYGLQLPGNNDEFVPVSSWTIDQFQLPGNSGADAPNPSGLSLDMTSFQQPTFRFTGGKNGGVYFGFTVDGVFYPGHFIPAQNLALSEVNRLRNLNVPARRTCERDYDGSSEIITQKVGFANDTGGNTNTIGGIYFVATATLSLPTSATFSMKLTNVFTTGAPESVDQVPFAADLIGSSNDAPIYTNLTDNPTGQTLLRLRATQYFNGFLNPNKTTWRPTKLEAQVISDTMTDSAVFQVWANPVRPTNLPGSYIPVGPDSAMEKYTTAADFDAGTTEGIKLATVVVGSGERATVDIPEYFISSWVSLQAVGANYSNHDEITVVAVSKPSPSANTVVTATLFGVEEH